MKAPDISVVVPLFNEEESLPELVAWIGRIFTEHQFNGEIILIDDGSADSSWEVIKELAERFKIIKAIRFNRNYGKSAALNKGFEAASGQVVITMDADMQDSPDEIPELYNMIANEGYDLVSGWKKNVMTRLQKQFPLNFLIRLLV